MNGVCFEMLIIFDVGGFPRSINGVTYEGIEEFMGTWVLGYLGTIISNDNRVGNVPIIRS